MDQEETESRAAGCQAVSRWDESCDLSAAQHCEACGLWYCAAHLPDPAWHPCVKQKSLFDGGCSFDLFNDQGA